MNRNLSSMAAVLSVCLLFMCFFLLIVSDHVHGGQAQHHHLISIESLLPRMNCSSPSSSSAGLGSLKVVHRRGPCSPLGPHKRAVNHGRLLRQDHSRVRSIHRHLSASQNVANIASTIPARSGLSFGIAEYIVSIGVGTPKHDFSVIFDTGSDLTWIQCQPCRGHCYPQKEPLFDPSRSSTYANISCSSGKCSLASDMSGCQDSSCMYTVQYGDGSSTTGFFAQETVTLSPSDMLANFMFGCGEMNQGLFSGVAGLLGLGKGAVSLVSQFSDKYGSVFSYCLPPFASSTGYLTFGAGALPSPSNLQFTALKSNPSLPTYYFVELVGISVNGKMLPITPDVFSAGTILDSGTVITRLPPDAYVALRDEFRRQMGARYPAAPALAILDTCYDLTGHDKVSVPVVALQFSGGVTINVDASGILYIADIAQACLAFAANDEPRTTAIIGNMQQRTYNVVYDVAGGRIGFGLGGCS